MMFLVRALLAGIAKVLAGVALLFILLGRYDRDGDAPIAAPEPAEEQQPAPPTPEE